MISKITIIKATVDDIEDIAVMTGELLKEIMDAIDSPVFHFNLEETRGRLEDFILHNKYVVFIARERDINAIGFIALYECHALYAEGSFGTIPELYVRPEYRSSHVGLGLIQQAKSFAKKQSWKRLEVTTPPLPQFDKTLAFYEREGFSVSGGRKLKVSL